MCENYDDLLQAWLDSFDGAYERSKHDNSWLYIDVGGWDQITSFDEFIKSYFRNKGEKRMNWDDAVAYVVYRLYNWLGTHRFPDWILDLFLPFLCYETTYLDVVMECWRHPRGFVVRPDVARRGIPDYNISLSKVNEQ